VVYPFKGFEFTKKQISANNERNLCSHLIQQRTKCFLLLLRIYNQLPKICLLVVVVFVVVVVVVVVVFIVVVVVVVLFIAAVDVVDVVVNSFCSKRK